MNLQIVKKEKDNFNFINEENEFNEKFKEFSKNFDKFYIEFSDYINSIKDTNYINEDIINNIRKYQINIINQIEDIKNYKNTKIFEISNKFDEKININKINELINDILDVNIHTENESLKFDKSNSLNSSNFYSNLNNNDNSNSQLSDKENIILESNKINNNSNIIKEALKCYECNKEAINQCNNKECCNFFIM